MGDWETQSSSLSYQKSRKGSQVRSREAHMSSDLHCMYCGFPTRENSVRKFCANCRKLISRMKVNAYYRVRKAILNGSLKKPNLLGCVDCGKTAKYYEHRDYRKPLKVDPICHGCNLRRGPATHLLRYWMYKLGSRGEKSPRYRQHIRRLAKEPRYMDLQILKGA